MTHDVHSVKRFCTRAIWINNGEIVRDGNVNEVTDAYLDFLKIESSEEIKTHEKSISFTEDTVNTEMVSTDYRVDDLASIIGFHSFNSTDEETNIFRYGEKVKVKVEYVIGKYQGDKLVIGVAILRIDNMYICGLNTLLDKIPVDCNKKRGSITLEYNSMDLMPGSYYFDCGLMEENAYVNLDYKTKICEFQITSDYIGEGIVILKHKWSVTK